MADLYYPQTLEDALNESYQEDAAVSAIKFNIHERISWDASPFYKSIYLYMPESLSNPTNVTWDSQGVGVSGAAALNDMGWGTLGDIASARMSNTSASWNAAVQEMKNKLGGGSDATGSQLQSLATGKTVNPYMKMMFRSANFRNFEFLFKFTPHNKDESARIHEIIQEFRAAALPSTGGPMCSTPNPNAFHLQYPKELEIEYLYQGDTHPWLNRFKRCVITDLNVNYTGAGFYATMRDGFPAQTELRMTFSETEIVYREDICTRGPSY